MRQIEEALSQLEEAQTELGALSRALETTDAEISRLRAEMAAARERERELEDVVRFLAGAVSEAYAARNEAMGMDAEECKEHLIMRFPTIQTTRALFAVDRIAAQPYRKGVAGRALIRLAAPTSAAHTEAEKLGPWGCRCQTFHHRMSGDGCDICQPEAAHTGEGGEHGD